MGKQKHEVITFKVDNTLAAVLKNIPNRSQFIRNAVFRALENICPLCQGSGILNVNQKEHWESFINHHSIKKCVDCESIYIQCDLATDKSED
jgi:hypothetical protein